MKQIGKCRPPLGVRQRQRGAILIIFCLSVVGMMAMIGVALDLLLVYNRKAELQTLADGTALAAARQLNGQAVGVTNARDQALTVANSFSYQYNNRQVDWGTNALRFSTTRDGGWLTYAEAKAAPAGVLFVKTDTADLPAAEDEGDIVPGIVNTMFTRLFGSDMATVATTARAVAGSSSMNVMPLAICAMSAAPGEARLNGANPAFKELIEYGFRRGVAYDLMKLNPGGAAGENFVIDPLSPPGTPGSAANTSVNNVAPFVCNGSMLMTSVVGGQVTVTRGFPINNLHPHINSRMDTPGSFAAGRCALAAAPPDTNVKAYVSPAWMVPSPATPAAASLSSEGKLWTQADPAVGAATSSTQYGTLWASAKAVKYASYVSGKPEPDAGYTTFADTEWNTLYAPKAPASFKYQGPPYAARADAIFFLAPTSGPGANNRRMLNVPLLSCPVTAGGTASATVLAIARFFLTAPADAGTLTGEFAGLAPAASLPGAVELYK
jgi:hypothetical protein